MKQRRIYGCLTILVLSVIISGGITLTAAIPAEERAALIALYNAVNGDGWRFNTGWKEPPLHTDGFAMPGTEGDWIGVTVENDHVTGINLFRLYIQGTLPPELGNLSQLESLGLSLNYGLTGSIPPELGNLSNLKTFSAWLTRLSGPIPRELGNLTNLQDLNLEYNQLTGIIPRELGNLTNLEELALGSNQLSGSIPGELGNLVNLKNLTLEQNRLSGSIPWELGNLDKLHVLKLYRNRLTGKIPSSFVNLESTLLMMDHNGLYTDDDALKAFLDRKSPGWDSTQTVAPADVSVTSISSTSARVSWTPIAYTGDTGGYRVFSRTTSGGPWAFAGMTADKLASFFEVHGLEPDLTYCFAVQTRTNPHNQNSNTVNSGFSKEVCGLSGTPGPFGSFDTPIDGSTVRSSIPVTGWALDDLGVAYVKIYREENQSLSYIGDAVLVEGARPDVERAYPDYPNNNKAGWGYMMLTNSLPDGGNGTFAIHAVAADMEGNQTTLGVKTIICDNANAVKPFGAIDTPGQGGIASGSQFVNFGWVLTPLPNTIPIDGSTITVWVDGVPLGHPVYNQYRADIAALFPAYNNSNGAVGYFYLDTTAYEDGVHTIQWTASDDAGNNDGIGSRFFTIQNTGESRVQRTAHSEAGRVCREQACLFRYPIRDIPIDYSSPVGIKKGYNRNIEPQIVYPGEDGTIYIEIKELERLEIHLSDSEESTLSIYSLPIGSTFDSARGVFYWSPGPGFIGEYWFVFVTEESNNQIKRKIISIKIKRG